MMTPDTLVPLPLPPEPTGVTTDSALLRHNARQEAWDAGWQQIIDYTLVEWGSDPSMLEEAELIPPSGRAIRAAIAMAQFVREAGMPPPTRVVPDGDGGIVMERAHSADTASIEIDRDGAVEIVLTRQGRVVRREPAQIG